MRIGRLRLSLNAVALILVSLLPAPDALGTDSSLAHVYDASALKDGEYLRGWLLCGPFPNPGTTDSTGACTHDGTCEGFFTDYLASAGGETGVVPQHDFQVLGPDQKTRRWKGISTLGDRVYLDQYFSPAAFQTGYAACWIDSADDEDRLFGVGGDDGVRIWVNGEEIFRFHGARTLTPDEHYVRLPLKAGRNLVLIKIDNGTERWGFMMRPVENASAVKECINRLRKVLRFDARVSDAGFEVTLGDPLVIGNLWDLPEAEISVLNRAGDKVHTFTAALCRPVLLPHADFPEEEYVLEGKVLWPYRGRMLVPGMIHRGDLRAEVRGMLAGEPPTLPAGPVSDAYRNLLDSTMQRDQFNGFGGETFAYHHLKSGLTQALQSAIKSQNANSPHDLVFPRPRQIGTSGHASVAITRNWTLQTAESIFDSALDEVMIQRWRDLTSRLAGAATGKVYIFALESDFLNVATPELEVADSPFQEAAVAIRDVVPIEAEGYAIRIQGDAVIIAGRKAAGAFYGLDTFLQLLSNAPESEDATLALEGSTIIDAPVYRTRASLLPLQNFDDDFKGTVDRLAALRYNLIFLPSSHYTGLDQMETQNMLVEAYAYCRAHFVEPIPLIETFGAETVVTSIEPNLLEGTYVEELHVVVDELRRVHLPYDRILESETTKPRLRTEKGYSVLRKDRDYVFESFAPPVIQLKGQAPVQTGDTLLVTADLVDRSQADAPACCPSDTRTWLLVEQIMAGVYAHLKPKGVHLGQSGAGYLNRDSRCLERAMPNDLILADAVQKGTDIVRKLDQKAEIFIWGEYFNPLQRALELDGLKSPQQLPKDITVLDAHYRSASYYDIWRLEEGIQYFDQFGFDTMGVVRSDPLTVAYYAAMKGKHPQRFRGLVHHPIPGDEGGQYLTAQAGWEGTTMLGSLELTTSSPTLAAR